MAGKKLGHKKALSAIKSGHGTPKSKAVTQGTAAACPPPSSNMKGGY